MSEFIGSRISLISKSDIKYIGTLHEINSTDSTVALENVKSYGTEGRKGQPELEIPPSDQIYEYIVFRGSDVKDLTIVEPPKENKPPPTPQMPNDPAILGGARPPQQQNQPPQQDPSQWRGQQPPPFPPYGYPPQHNPRFAPPGGPHGFPGAPGAVPGYGMPYGGPPPPGWFPPNHGFPQGPPPFSPHQGQQTPVAPQGQQHRPSDNGHASKQPTPSQPTGPQAPPQASELLATELSATPAPPAAADLAPPPPNDTKPDVTAATAAPKSAPRPTAKTGNRNSKVAVPLASKPNTQGAARPGNVAPLATPAAATATTQQQNATQAAAAAVAAAMAKLGPIPSHPPSQAPGQASIDGLTRKVSELRTDDRTRHSRQPPAAGFQPGHRGGRGGNRRPSTRETGQKPVDVPGTDFDFESSNAKFNKQDMAKEAIATGSPMGTPAGEDESKQLPSTNGGTNGTSHEDDVVIPSSTANKYNKSTSFFDNISSEIKDRQTAQDEGKKLGGMEFRREERSKNLETFGQSNVENGRGGFRGRGRGRGRGFGGRGRGYGGGGGGGRGDFASRGGRPGEDAAEV